MPNQTIRREQQPPREGSITLDSISPGVADAPPVTGGSSYIAISPLRHIATYFTSVDSLKIGRMIAIAMKPTTPPITMIMMGSIIDVTVLITSRSCLL